MNTVACMVPYSGLLENDTLHLLIKGHVFDLRGNTYKDTTLSMDLKKLSQYGSISVVYPTVEQVSLIPFLSSKTSEFIYSDSKTDTTALFSGLEPGEYFLKLIIDYNDDGRINSGSYLGQIQPESIYVHPETIKLKANWDVDKVRIPVDLVLTYMDKLKQIDLTPNQDGLDIDKSENSDDK